MPPCDYFQNQKENKKQKQKSSFFSTLVKIPAWKMNITNIANVCLGSSKLATQQKTFIWQLLLRTFRLTFYSKNFL